MTRLALVKPAPAKLIAALYCRYSDDVQNDRSIERQIADLEKAAPRWNLTLDKRLYCEDRGQSATTLFNRPGLTRDLLGAAERGLFDVIFVEHTDRLARKGADMFWLAEQLKFMRGPAGQPIKIYTPRSGEVSELQMTFESYQNAQDSEKTSFRVRSGHSDRAREGFISNSPAYGYENVLHEPGVKKVNDSEAIIVNRIVSEMAAWKSPRNIAVDLTRDGVPAPRGEAWTFQTIVKILQNDLYVGVYVRNKVRKIRNPNNGKRVPRAADPDELVTVAVPQYRIVDQDLWDAAQKVRRERASKFGKRHVERATVHRFNHPFMGLFRCADCGGKMIICGRGKNKDDRRIVCAASHWRRQCSHSKSYSLLRLSKLASERMHGHLTDPDFVNERARERAKHLDRMVKEFGSERDTAQKELDRVELRIRKLTKLALDDDSDDIPQDVQDEHKRLRVEQRGLKQRIGLLDAETKTPPLLGSAIKALSRDVETLHTMLKDSPNDPACRMALGNLIERVVVHPTGSNLPYDVSLYARHAAYSGTLPLFPHENHGLIRANSGNAILPSLSELDLRGRTNSGDAVVPSLSEFAQPILLGRWREAA
jgi:site-specific DNA recombinase